MSDREEAIVVGLCAHGLDLIRALAFGGVKVYAIESKRHLPGTKTRLATVALVDDISGPNLVSAIRTVAQSTGSRTKPSLLLTNDKMVFDVAANMEEITEHVRVSWQDSKALVPKLLEKDNLPALCSRAGLRYPRSATITCIAPRMVEASVEGLSFPMIVKPVRPMASFKAVLITDLAALCRHIATFSTDLPIIAQEWVPGDVTALKFSAIYFDNGRPLAHFEGRKLNSHPRAMGTTTVAEGIESPRVFNAALSFFKSFNLSGPVSLEVKEDSQGELWVIEPTAFRTDYWAGCCIANGVNLPLIEVRHQLCRPLPQATASNRRIWIDIERDPAAIAAALRSDLRGALFERRLAVTYMERRDPLPFLALLGDLMQRLTLAVFRRLRTSALRIFFVQQKTK